MSTSVTHSHPFHVEQTGLVTSRTELQEQINPVNPYTIYDIRPYYKQTTFKYKVPHVFSLTDPIPVKK